jgi:hypothetical protein
MSVNVRSLKAFDLDVLRLQRPEGKAEDIRIPAGASLPLWCGPESFYDANIVRRSDARAPIAASNVGVVCQFS